MDNGVEGIYSVYLSLLSASAVWYASRVDAVWVLVGDA